MKMAVKKEQMERAIAEVAGADVLPLVGFLKNKKNISEFKIADALKREVNETRNMLYRLYHNNLVSFIRRKDKKKGWYIYYWTFNPKQIKFLVGDLKHRRLERLKERLDREKDGNFFSCPDSCIRLDFEQALGFEFKCPECGELMNQEDNQKIIKNIKADIEKLEKEIR